jgi:hypothetical protein
VVCGELLDENTDGENYENKICGTVSCYEEAGIIPEWMGNSYYANDYLQEFPAEVLEKYGYGAEEPSVYWWIKGALMEKMKDDKEVTIDDVENIIVMVAANAPMDSITKGMKEAEKLGDKGVWEILKLAAIGRSEILTDDQIHSEKLRDYQAEEYSVADEGWAGQSCEDCYEEIKKGDLIHDDGYGILICKKCYSNYKIPCEHEACDERFKDKDEEREHRQETCNRCDGEGWVMTHYTPATYHDPADVDGEDCEECGGEGWVCDKFNAETFEARYGGSNCGKCGGDHSGYCPDYGEEDEYIQCTDCKWDGANGNWNTVIEWCSSCKEKNEIEAKRNAERIRLEKERDEQEERDFIESEKYNQEMMDIWEDRYFAESNGDKQLNESIKRTKYSAIRTGLALTTFGIVLWNLWTNKKQEKDIADIMAEI